MSSNRHLDLASVRRALDRDGYCRVDGLPGDFDHVAQLGRLGPLVPQYDGELVRDVRPAAGIGADVVAANGTTELYPHTEWYEFPGVPPRYIALWCVHAHEGAGGETTLADGYRLLGEFSAAERSRFFD